MAQVQTVTKTNIAGVTSETITITTQNTTAGNTLILVSSDNWGLVNQISGITDTEGNTWQRAKSISAGGIDGEVWYAYNIAGGTKPTLTITYAHPVQIALVLAEYSGFTTTDPFDQFSTGNGTSTAPLTASTPTTSQASETVIGACVWGDMTIGGGSVGSGFANFIQVGASFINDANSMNAAIEDKTISSIGTPTAAITLARSRAWVMFCITFKNAPISTSFSTKFLLMGVGK